MVVERLLLAGRSSSSRLHESPGIASSVRSSVLPKAIPGPPKSSPLVFRSQLTRLGGKGLKGQSVANKIAAVANPQRIARSFFSRTKVNLSFADNFCGHLAPSWKINRTSQTLAAAKKPPEAVPSWQ